MARNAATWQSSDPAWFAVASHRSKRQGAGWLRCAGNDEGAGWLRCTRNDENAGWLRCTRNDEDAGWLRCARNDEDAGWLRCARNDENAGWLCCTRNDEDAGLLCCARHDALGFRASGQLWAAASVLATRRREQRRGSAPNSDVHKGSSHCPPRTNRTCRLKLLLSVKRLPSLKLTTHAMDAKGA